MASDIKSIVRYLYRTVLSHPRRIGRVVVGLLFGCLILFLLLRSVDFDRIVTTIANASKMLLGFSIGVYLLSWPIRGARFGVILSALDTRYFTNGVMGRINPVS